MSDVYNDDVGTDFFDILEADYEFGFVVKPRAEPIVVGYDNFTDLPGTFFKF